MESGHVEAGTEKEAAGQAERRRLARPLGAESGGNDPGTAEDGEKLVKEVHGEERPLVLP